MSNGADDESPSASWMGGLQVTTDDMNRLVMDYLISVGYRDAAEKFCEESGLPFPEDANNELNARIAIRQTLVEGHVQEAIQLINDLVPELLDDDRYLHFHLLSQRRFSFQQQQLIELIREAKVDAALQFAQEYLVEKGEHVPKTLEEIEKTLALLAFDKPEESPFGYLMQFSHRHQLADEVNSAVLKALSQPPAPRLENLIQMVMWSQQQLDKKRISYAKMTDIGTAEIADKSHRRSLVMADIDQHRLSRRDSST